MPLLDEKQAFSKRLKDALRKAGVDAAGLLQPIEHRRALVAGQVDDRLAVFRQHPRQVFQQAAAGDVAQGGHLDLLDEFQQRLHINAGRRHQRLRQRGVPQRLLQVGAADLQDLANQRITVGEGPRGGQADQHIALRHLGAITGRVHVEELLDRIFRDFCIGK